MIPTASVVRYYTEIQSCLTVLHRDTVVSYGCCVSLLLVSKLGTALVEFVQWEFRNSPTRHLLDLRDLLLIDCTTDLLAPIVSLCR